MTRSLALRACTTIGTLAALAAVAASPAAAQGGPPTIPFTSGESDWGIKQSFRNYIKGPIAHGAIDVQAPATENADGTFRWAFTSGSYDLATHSVTAAFDGAVHFTGHGGILDTTFSDPEIETSGNTGTLILDAVSNDPAGEPATYTDVEFADLDLSTATRTIAGEVVTITGIKATLTEEGAPAFGGFYTAGSALDDVALRLSYADEPDPDPDPTPQPKPKPNPPAPPADPGPAQPGPKVAAARITRTAKAVKVGGRRVALARLACRTGTCTVATKKFLKVKIGKRTYRVAVIAPKSLAEGKRGTVRVALSKAAYKALAGRKAKVGLKVVVSSGDESVTQTVRVTLRRGR